MKAARAWLRRALVYAGSAVVLLVVLAAGLWVAHPRTVLVDGPFSAVPAEIAARDYYDLGAVDLNNDNALDLFTTNHSSRQSLLLSDGDGRYRDVLATFGMSHTAGFPGLEDTGKAPATSLPGLHFYVVGSTLHVVHTPGEHTGTISGSVAVAGQHDVRHKGFELTASTDGEPATQTSVRFVAVPDRPAHAEIDFIKSTPVRVTIDQVDDLNLIRVGNDAVSLDRSAFTLFLRDRHGIAWVDVNDDAHVDAFMSRGAVSGQAAQFGMVLDDQFFVSDSDGRYTNRAHQLGFVKRACPARQVAWADANVDGLLDLYIACGRQVGGFWEYVPAFLRRNRDPAPNQLFVQLEDGSFAESAADFGLDFELGGTFRWFDVDNDGDDDLLWADENELALYRNDKGVFARQLVVDGGTRLQTRVLAIADPDKDGDLDVFAAASRGSLVLLNVNGTLSVVEPTDVGLPSAARTATWVDYDNDGYLDLYAWPSGLHRRADRGGYVETGLLRMPSAYWPFIDPRVVWFDRDNDGDRDAIIMQRFFPQALQTRFPGAMPYTAIGIRNDSETSDRWLQIELRGPATNRQSIGASLIVTHGRDTERMQVGQFDSAHYSQGHYRLYVGYAPDALHVQWPGRDPYVLQPPELGQRLQIQIR